MSPEQRPTLYDVLGVPPSASLDEIRIAYRKLAQQYHPDKPTGNERLFKLINEANQCLTDSERRAAYDTTLGDTTLQQPENGQPTAQTPPLTPHGLLPASKVQIRLNLIKGAVFVGLAISCSVLADEYRSYEGLFVALLTVCYIAAFCQFMYRRYVVSYKKLVLSSIDTVKTVIRLLKPR